MSFTEILRMPAGTLISGTVRVPCAEDCGSTCDFEIDDIDKPGMGSELDGIDQQAEDLQYRCADCREQYLINCARDAWKYDL